jgi:hypothetical protein
MRAGAARPVQCPSHGGEKGVVSGEGRRYANLFLLQIGVVHFLSNQISVIIIPFYFTGHRQSGDDRAASLASMELREAPGETRADSLMERDSRLRQPPGIEILETHEAAVPFPSKTALLLHSRSPPVGVRPVSSGHSSMGTFPKNLQCWTGERVGLSQSGRRLLPNSSPEGRRALALHNPLPGWRDLIA